MRSQKIFAAVAIVSAVTLSISGCAQKNPGGSGNDSQSSGKNTVTVFLSADTNVEDLWKKSLIPAFEKKYPKDKVNVDLDLHGEHDSQTIAKLTSATKQGKNSSFDLVDAGFVSQIADSGLLKQVSAKDIPPLKGIARNMLEAGGKGGIPYRASSVLLAYNSDVISKPPKMLDALLKWIKQHPGKFTYNTPDSGGAGQSFVSTVLDKYVDPQDRQKMVSGYHQKLESQWTKGFTQLNSLNKYIYQKGVYPNGNNQVLDLLASGEIAMAPVWSDQFITGQKHGEIPKKVKYTQIANPSLTGGAAYLGIPKASAHQAEAVKLANWLLSPKAQALVAKSIASYPIISLDKLPKAIRQQFKAADPSKLRLPYFAQMNEDLNKQWSEKVPH